MATTTWKGGAGNWDSSNWSTGAAPNVGDTAVISSGTVDVSNFTDQALSLNLTGGEIHITGELGIGTSTLGGRTGSISNSGGTILVDNGELSAGMYITSATGTVTLSGEGGYSWGGANSTQTITFAPNSENASFDFSTAFAGKIAGFGTGDFITYTGGGIESYTIGNDVVSLVTSAGTLAIHFTGSYNSSNLAVVGNTIETTAACYCAGALIRTIRGDVPIDMLVIGDEVITAFGAARPIRWIGRRSYAGRFLAANPDAQPIRFRAGSLGDGLPRRDLLVSPEHAMFLDGVLIPAKALVNGGMITQERGLDRVDYFHVELDHHSVILAEGAPSESFLEDGNRGQFQNAAEHAALYPDAPAPGDRCAPWVDCGAELEAVRHRLAEVAGKVALAA